MIYLRLYCSFFKVGLFTFGGGLSMFPMLEREMIMRRQWCTKEEILDYYAVGQCTPGVIAVDVAAFIGYRKGKTLGAIIGPLGVITPGVLIMLLMATALQRTAGIEWMQSAFAGIRVAVCALLTVSLVNILRESIKRWWQLLITAAAFAAVALLGANPAWVVLGAVVLGLFGALRANRATTGEK